MYTLRRSLIAIQLAGLLGLCIGVAWAADEPTPAAPSGSGASRPSQDPTSPIVGRILRFSAGPDKVDVTIEQDNPTVRDLLSMLPLTLKLEEFAGREKIGYLPRKLAIAGSPGSDPEDGDLIYFVPWGNLGFYYDTSGIGYSDLTIHIGRYAASRDRLAAFAGRTVRVELVQ